jgi:hypothetical protein
LKKEVVDLCDRLERDITQVESLVRKSKEVEIKNREILERDYKLNTQICELQQRLVTHDKVRYVQNQFLRCDR